MLVTYSVLFLVNCCLFFDEFCSPLWYTSCSIFLLKSSRRRWLTAVLSQHRTYRSVYGAFNSWRAQTDRLWLNHKSHCLSVFLYSAPKSQLCYYWYTSTFFDCLLLLPHSVLEFPAWLGFYISFWVSSIVSICTCVFCDRAIHWCHLCCSSYLQFRSS